MGFPVTPPQGFERVQFFDNLQRSPMEHFYSASQEKSKERDLGFFGGTKGEEPKGGANS